MPYSNVVGGCWVWGGAVELSKGPMVGEQIIQKANKQT